MNPICGCILSQHALEDCTIKFESNRILLSAGYNSFQVFDAVKDADEVSRLPSKSKSKVRRHQTLPKFSEIVSPLHYCAYATGCRGNSSLLTEQALPLSEGSLSRQQVLGTSCVLALPVTTLCCCINWILQITAVLFCPTEGIGSYVSCMPHSCQVRTASAALFCLYSTVVFTDQPRALQSFSAAVSPHTERCADWLPVPVRTRALIERFAHSNVASLNTSSHA